MKTLPDNPERWSERVGQSNVAERAAGNTVRALPQPPALSSATYARIWANVQMQRPRLHARWAFAMAAAVLGIATVASAARMGFLALPWSSKSASTAEDVRASSRPPRRAIEPGAKVEDGPATAAQAPTASAKPADAATIGLPPASSSRGMAGPVPGQDRPRQAKEAFMAETGRQPETTGAVPVAPGSPGPVGLPPDSPQPAAIPYEQPLLPSSGLPPQARPAASKSFGSPILPGDAPEAPSRALAAAVQALRVQHAPDACLAILDQHGREIVSDGLAYEALILRVEALLALKRDPEALHLLDGEHLAGPAVPRRLLVLRGALRAAANRCGDSLQDFDRVLEAGGRPDRQALLGRAVCRERLGDLAGFRADRERYEKAFPDDRGTR